MKQELIPLFVALMTFPIASQAEKPIDPREAEIEALVRNSPKQHLKELLDYNLKKLEAVYEEQLEKVEDDDHRIALENSQEAWRKFFESDGAMASWNAKGGSFAYPAQMEQKIYQVRLRMYQLATPFLAGWSEIPRVPNPKAEQDGAQ